MVEQEFWVLIAADSDAGVACDMFEASGFSCRRCSCAEVAGELDQSEPSVLMAVSTCSKLKCHIAAWKRKSPATQIVVWVSTPPSVEEVVELLRSGAWDVWAGALDRQRRDVLIDLVERVHFVRKSRIERLRLQQTAQAFGIFGESLETAHMIEQARRAGKSDATVLITGETGTGKTLVARAIHALSKRNGKPFVVVDCGGLVGTLADTELYGSKKGAFTGAAVDRIGLVQSANGGTVLLDEIGDLPLDLQPKLLRLLEEREVRRVGDTQSTRLDIRLIAATNRDLTNMVRAGEFRSDLYFRLEHQSIEAVPLRQRPEDIVPLAKHFVSLSTFNGIPLRIDEAASTLLRAHEWPGNVRELKATVEAAAQQAPGASIRISDLPDRLLAAMSLGKPAIAGGAAARTEFRLDRLERAAIEGAMQATDNNISEAATLLGIGRTTLYRKLKASPPAPDIGFDPPLRVLDNGNFRRR